MYITSNPNQVPIGSRDFLSFGCKVYPLHSLQGDDKMPWPAGFLLERSTSFYIEGKATWKRHCFWLDVFVLANLGDSSSSNSGITNRYPSSLARCLQTLEATWKTQLSIWAIWVIWVIPVGKVLLMMTHPKHVETLHHQISRVDLPSGRRPRWRRRTRRPHQTDPTAQTVHFWRHRIILSPKYWVPRNETPNKQIQYKAKSSQGVFNAGTMCWNPLTFYFAVFLLGLCCCLRFTNAFVCFLVEKKIAISDWGTQSSKPLDGMRSKFPPLLCIILITCFPFQIPNHQNPRIFFPRNLPAFQKTGMLPQFSGTFWNIPSIFLSNGATTPAAPSCPSALEAHPAWRSAAWRRRRPRDLRSRGPSRRWCRAPRWGSQIKVQTGNKKKGYVLGIDGIFFGRCKEYYIYIYYI